MKKHSFVFISVIFLFFSCLGSTKTEIAIIPQPVEMTIGEGSFSLNSKTIITYDKDDLEKAAGFLQNKIEEETGLKLTLKKNSGENNSIYLDYESTGESQDSYNLSVKKNNVSIVGANSRSVLLGIQTLRQLLPIEKKSKINLQEMEIKDHPAWEWRGMMMDVSRHFFNKEEVKEFLDIMAYYKFNRFHWHLTDDQGWRIEIKKYPLLTEVSTWREFNNHDKDCLRRAEKENNTDFLLPENKMREVNGKKEHGGYYTQDDIKEIVQYAADLGIDVVPEIDMPGHFMAAIAAYPELSCFNSGGWGADFSEPLCPGKDATIEVCKNIFSEVFELFPYEYVHLGADEVEKTNWKKCPHCQKRIKDEKLKDEKELQSWFVRQMANFFEENNKKLIGWDEIIEGGLASNSTVMWWRTWARNSVKRATSQENNVILTPNSHYYFDYQQTAKTLQDLYEFEPIPNGISEDEKTFILGVQANVWAEAIPSIERFQYMTFPRMLALSEIAWRYDSGRSWAEFFPRLVTHFPRLDKKNVNYYPLTISDLHERNVFVGKKTIEWNHPLSNIELYYTTDGSIPDKNSAKYTKPFSINETTEFTIRMFRPDGSAADIYRAVYSKDEYKEGQETIENESGLNCFWHEGIFRKCEDIKKAPRTESYLVDGIVIPKGVGGKRGLVYSGYIFVPKQDIYTFQLGSDDGSQLYIHNNLVVDNDGPHGPITLSGQVALDKGFHPIELFYFDMNNGGFVSLKLFDSEKNEIELNKEIFRQ